MTLSTLRSIILLGLTALLAACSLLPGASISPRELALRELVQRQAQWQSKGIDDYTLSVTRSCFCPQVEPADVTVVDGVVTAVTRAGVPLKPDDVRDLPKTVPELFAVIAGLGATASVTVEWDATFGYPTTISMDPIPNAVDDEYTITVANFRPAS